MEFTMDAVANKMILLVICLSLALMVIGAAFFYFHPSFHINGALPFATGVAIGMAVNIVIIFWLKKAITKAVDMEVGGAAKVFFQFQYFLRIVFTGVALLAAALFPDSAVNLLGAVAGILMLPIAMRCMQSFIPNDAKITTPPDAADADITKPDALEADAEAANCEGKGD
jgi:hypothetical protein